VLQVQFVSQLNTDSIFRFRLLVLPVLLLPLEFSLGVIKDAFAGLVQAEHWLLGDRTVGEIDSGGCNRLGVH
jgi:hypothetical protein